MKLCIPFCFLDAPQALRLIQWIGDLGGCAGHECLLITHDDTPFDIALECRKEAQNSFDSIELVSSGRENSGWINGACSLFKIMAQKLAGQPFFILDPDAVPLKTGWLDAIFQSYLACGKAFMGPLIKHNNPKWPNPYLEAISVYPPDAWTRISPFWSEHDFWMRSAAPVIVPNAANSSLIHHFWGEKGNPPTFSNRNLPGTAIFSPAQIRKEAVVFHRCKDASLINLLKKHRGIDIAESDQEILLINSDRELTIDLVYILVVGIPGYLKLASKFVSSYREHPPHYPHRTIIVCNNGIPDDETKHIFNSLPNINYFLHDNSGFDIGGFQHVARESDSELILCLGSSGYINRTGWMRRIAESYLKHGEALYGTMGNRGAPAVKVNRHIRSTGFWLPPKLLAEYPKVATQKQDRYEFEFGKNCLTEWVMRKGLKAWVVGWRGEFEWAQWDNIPNGFHRGDQSNLIIGDRLTQPPYY